MQQGFKLSLVLVALGFAQASVAQEAGVYDRVDLAASAERDVDNDLLVAVVFAEVEANKQAEAAQQVNEKIQWAVERARRTDGMQIQTAQYTTRPVYANGRRITGWIARQSLRLESEDAGAMSDLLGALQERVAIQSVNYDVSKKARDDAEDALIAEALQQFKHRAELVARELGREGFRIVRLNVGTSGTNPVPFLRSAAVAEAAPAPPIEAGVQTFSVSINGTVELDAPR